MTAAKATTVLLSEAEIDRLELRLQNWVKWSKANSAGVKRCGSAEGRYLAVSVDDEGFASKVELESIDHIDGELVDQALIALPTTADRAYLFLHYLKDRQSPRLNSSHECAPSIPCSAAQQQYPQQT